MARCPKLDYESNSLFGTSSDKYICTVTGQKMDIDDKKVKYVCNPSSGYDYEQCQIYRDR